MIKSDIPWKTDSELKAKCYGNFVWVVVADLVLNFDHGLLLGKPNERKKKKEKKENKGEFNGIPSPSWFWLSYFI